MNRQIASLPARAGAVALLLAGSIAAAQERQTTLRLAVEPAKAEIALGEPAYVTLTLTNIGAQPVKIVPDLRLESGYASLSITTPSGRAFTFVPLAIDDVDAPRRELGPGASLAAVNQVFFGGMGWSFTEPGSYGITASFSVPGAAPVVSARVNVSVGGGDGAGRLLLGADRVTQMETGKFLVWQQGDHLRRALALLPQVIDRFPASPVADHARVALGANLSRSFNDAGAIRPAKPEEALRYLDAARGENLPRVVRLQQQLARARALESLGRKTEAQNALDAAREITSDQPALREQLEQN